MADKNSKPSDFRRPGHVFPLISKPMGVLERMVIPKRQLIL